VQACLFPLVDASMLVCAASSQVPKRESERVRGCRDLSIHIFMRLRRRFMHTYIYIYLEDG
jgi:hypothetical protein